MPDELPNPEQAARLANQPAELDFSQAEYKRFYANHVAATMSLFEVRVIFSSVQGVDPGSEKLVVDELMNVRMAPELALALVQQLQKTLREYVTLFGNLRPTKVFPPAKSKSQAPEESSGTESPPLPTDPPAGEG